MSLTRRLLKELELNDNAIERIIAAHAETVTALRQERDAALASAEEREALARERDEWCAQSEAHQADLAQAQAEFTAYREEVDRQRHHDARRAALADALARFGANPQAIPLMLDACPLREEDWNGDALADEGAVLNAVKARYAPLFDAPRKLPTARITPPDTSGGPLTPDDLRRMSPEDINRSWSAVRLALDAR